MYVTVVGIGSMCWHVACVSFATVSVGAARTQTSDTNKMAETGESNLSLQKKNKKKERSFMITLHFLKNCNQRKMTPSFQGPTTTGSGVPQGLAGVP